MQTEFGFLSFKTWTALAVARYAARNHASRKVSSAKIIPVSGKFSSVLQPLYLRPPLAQTLFQPATRSTEHPAFRTVGQALRPYLYLLCPPGQTFKIKHIASYWTALPIAPAGSSP